MLFSHGRRLFSYPLAHRAGIAIIFVLTLTSIGLSVLQPWPMKMLVDYALQDVEVPHWLAGALAGIGLGTTATALIVLAAMLSLVLFTLNAAAEAALTWRWTATGQRMTYDLAVDLMDRLQRLSPLYHTRRHVGDLLSRVTSDSYCVYMISEALLVTPVQKLLLLLAIGVVAWQLDPVLTLLCFSVAPLLAGSAHYFGPRIKRRSREHREAHAQVMSFVHQTINAIPIVQAFASEQRNRDHFDQLADDAVETSQRSVVARHAFDYVNGVLSTAGIALVLYVGGMRVLTEAMTLGSLLVFIGYMETMRKAWEKLLTTYGKLRKAEASIDRVFEVLDAEEAVAESADAVAPAEPVRGRIAFEQVRFGYEPNQPVLEEISFQTHAGEQVALVGPTGAGKSTLVSLIPRFFDPWQGRIRLDDQDLRSLTLQGLRRQIALVPQEPLLLPMSIAENIAYGYPNASLEQIQAAAKAANADEFIEQLEEGYQTLLGERGATLSGGQRQRLAIARAFLKDAPIVIMDEPTAALDALSERHILDALARLRQGRTTFIIAHRLSTIRQADRILVLQRGRIVQQGTHQQLIEQNGLYLELHFGSRPGLTQEVSP